MKTVKRLLGKAYEGKKDYVNATKYYKELAMLVDSLKEREQRSAAVELAKVYETHEKEAEIDRHKKHISYQHIIILISMSVLVLILAGLFIILQLYRKRNAAYKVLAIKAEEWATRTVEQEQEHEQEPEPSIPKPRSEVTPEDKQIMLLLQEEMENYAYREAGLTAEILADRLGIHRNTLSHAINRTTAGNFNTYINGFRIKEAVRIILQTNRKKLYIDELYERVGFGNRSSFSRIFKQFTGLSPLEFQKQEVMKVKKM